MTTDKEIWQIANALRADPTNVQALARASDLIAEQDGDALLLAIISQEEAEGHEHHVAVANAMTHAEASIEVVPAVGEYLMARLYPIAISAYRHDVADAIGLWITSRGNAKLATMLRAMSVREPNEKIRQEYIEWANAMPNA